MDTTLTHLIESFKGTQGAAVAVALSVGLLLLTVLQHASRPQRSVPASLPLKVEAVSICSLEWSDLSMHQKMILAIVLMLFDSYISTLSKA